MRQRGMGRIVARKKIVEVTLERGMRREVEGKGVAEGFYPKTKTAMLLTQAAYQTLQAPDILRNRNRGIGNKKVRINNCLTLIHCNGAGRRRCKRVTGLSRYIKNNRGGWRQSCRLLCATEIIRLTSIQELNQVLLKHDTRVLRSSKFTKMLLGCEER